MLSKLKMFSLRLLLCVLAYNAMLMSALLAKAGESVFAPAIIGLHPQSGDCGLLLGFATDMLQDDYARVCESKSLDPFPRMPKSINISLYLTRIGDTVCITAKLTYIASPQRDGFHFLGQAVYYKAFKVKLDGDGMTSNVGYDYTRIWGARSRDGIVAAQEKAVKEMERQFNLDYVDEGKECLAGCG